MDLFSELVDKFGIKTAVLLFIGKTLWEMIRGSASKYLKAIEENTNAIVALKTSVEMRLDKLDDDLTVAFYNIKDLKGGKIEMPPPKRDQ